VVFNIISAEAITSGDWRNAGRDSGGDRNPSVAESKSAESMRRTSLPSRKRSARWRKSPVGSFTPRSYFANVPGSTPIYSATPSRDSSSVVRYRSNCSASVSAGGNGL
jgi:hypothetical protein